MNCFAPTTIARRVLAPAALLLAAGCATNPVTGDQDIVFMSEADEIALGRQVDAEVRRQYQVYPDRELQEYVQQIGRRLAANSHRPQLQYTFTVLDSAEVNAFALPGGHIFITRGLMAYLNSEAQLAAVLGHEIGHVTARHAVRQHSATQLAGIGAALGAALLPALGQPGGSELTGLLGNALLRGYGREHELEADRLGTEYLARSAYEPDAMLQVVRVLKNQELFEMQRAAAEGRQPQVYHGLFSTHPDNDTRLQEVIAAAGRVAEVETPRIGRREYLDRIDGLTFGESASQGVLRGRDFLHAELGFTLRLPEQWQAANLPDRLVAVAPGDAAQLQLTVGGAAIGSSPRDFLTRTMGIGQPVTGQSLRINGLAAHTAVAVVRAGDGERMARLTVIYHERRAYVLAGVTSDPRALGNFDRVFTAAAGTFRALSAPERQAIAAQVRHLAVLRATATTSFGQLARDAPLKSFAEQQIRLLNGRYPAGEVRPGEYLKTVRQ
jgi:predicted Zn-dependent protease